MRFQISGVAEYGYSLVLNPMTAGIEAYQEFGPFPTMEILKAFYEGEKVPPYRDEGPDLYSGGTKSYSKSFRKGGPLEMMNAFEFMNVDWSNAEGFCNHYGHGVHLKLMNVQVQQRHYRLD